MKTQEDEKLLSVINVGSDGTFKPTGDYNTSPDEVDEFFVHLNDTKPGKIAIYFHGGLVSEANGLEAAKNMNGTFEKAGCVPLTFAWETGLWETLTDNLAEIHETALFKKLLKVALKILLKHLGLDVGVKGVGTVGDDEIEKELAKENPFADYKLKKGARGVASKKKINEKLLMAELEVEFEEEFAGDRDMKDILENEAPKTRLLDNGKLAESDGTGKKGLFIIGIIKNAAAIGFKVIKRFIEKRDHGIYPTVMEEILRELYIADLGAWFWDKMKTKSQEMFGDNRNRSGNELYAGGYFLGKLDAYMAENKGTTLDLVGHSAGTIAICNLLDAAAERFSNIAVRNIIFLAPACRCDLFYKQVVSHPKRFQHFRMFTMKDFHESKNKLFGIIYTRSLLYFISGVLEEEGKKADVPLLGLQRHIEGKEPYDYSPLMEIHQFLETPDTHRQVYAVTPAEQAAGFNSTADKHEDFDNNTETLESIIHILGG
ncbi:MAG: hypothetical protein GY765_37010 [bacterium]|nr:hypothetical protein [bacterium]